MTQAHPLRSALDILDMHVLYELDSRGALFGKYDTYYPLASLDCDGVLSRDFVAATCRSLTDRAHAQYMRGLFREDGTLGGAGYGITPKGHRYLMALEEIYRGDW